MSEIIKVGMADLKTCVSPDGVTTLGLAPAWESQSATR